MHDRLASHYRLQSLHNWLTLEGLGWLLLFATSYMASDSIFTVLVILAIVFTPFLFMTLYKEGRTGWLKSFAIVVGIPAGLSLIPSENAVVHMALKVFPLLMFYVYCWALRRVVRKWLVELKE